MLKGDHIQVLKLRGIIFLWHSGSYIIDVEENLMLLESFKKVKKRHLNTALRISIFDSTFLDGSNCP